MADQLKSGETIRFQCLHPSFMLNKCTNCHKSKIDCGNPVTLPFRYVKPNLTLTLQEIHRRRDDDMQSLISRKKLHLVLDLDHTLVHATSLYNELTNEEITRVEALGDAYQIFYGTYLVKLRPKVREFLKQVSYMFDLSVFTMSSRDYAREVVKLLDRDDPRNFSSLFDSSSKFSWVIANEDCVKENKKGLDVVLSHERVVLIVDDIKEVWENDALENLIKISPYKFFPVDKLFLEEEEEVKEMDIELTRVLSILRAVHELFYDEDGEFDYDKRDVRDILKKVMNDIDESVQKIEVEMKKIEF